MLASTPIPEFQRWSQDQHKEITMEAIFAKSRTYEATIIHIHHLNDRSNPSNISVVCANLKRKTQYIRCGHDHVRYIKACPAWNSKCHFCCIIGHWESCCLKKRNSRHRDRSSSRPHVFMQIWTAYAEPEAQ